MSHEIADAELFAGARFAACIVKPVARSAALGLLTKWVGAQIGSLKP